MSKKVYITIIVLLSILAICLICARATQTEPNTAVDEPIKDNTQHEKATFLANAINEARVIKIEHVYTPVPYDGETIITPDMIQELPDYERCLSIMAQMLWGEIRGGSDDAVAAVCWCVCNRATERTPAAVITQIQAPGQFHGYKSDYPVDDRLYKIAENVLMQWMMEPYTTVGINRILPEDYIYFGGDGQYNTFRNKYEGGEKITVK